MIPKVTSKYLTLLLMSIFCASNATEYRISKQNSENAAKDEDS